MTESKVLSIGIHSYNNNSYVSSVDLFDCILPYSEKYYTRWVRLNITEQPQGLPKKGRDYLFSDEVKLSKKPKNKPGRNRVELLVSISFARELCYQTKTFPAAEMREFLYKFIEKA